MMASMSELPIMREETISFLDSFALLSEGLRCHRPVSERFVGVPVPYFGPGKKRRKMAAGKVENEPLLLDWLAEAHATLRAMREGQPYFKADAEHKRMPAVADVPCGVPAGNTEEEREGGVVETSASDTPPPPPELADLCSMLARFGGGGGGGGGEGEGEGEGEDERVASLEVITEDDLLFQRLIVHAGDRERIAVWFRRAYVVPPRCSFLLGDMCCWRQLLPSNRYDLVVVDPPWESKSVSRAGAYATLPALGTLKALPVGRASRAGAIVAVWTTNNERVWSFAKDQLLGAWDCDYVGTWYWLKLTNAGELVCPLHSTHKKPYEPLVVGMRRARRGSQTRRGTQATGTQATGMQATGMQATASISMPAAAAAAATVPASTAGSEAKGNTGTRQGGEGATPRMAEGKSLKPPPAVRTPPPAPLPRRRVVASVPLGHSAKPSLNAVFAPYLPQREGDGEGTKLELFARDLKRGWCSVGNEVLKFQDRDLYFERTAALKQ